MKAGDLFQNNNGVIIEILETFEHNNTTLYRIIGSNDIEEYRCYKTENVIAMLKQNNYKEL